MLRQPATKTGTDHVSSYKMRLGVKMFIIYAITYMGFVAINVIKPILMEKIIFLGLNLATVYGFGLILFAFFLALIYNVMCTRKEAAMNSQESDDEVKSC